MDELRLNHLQHLLLLEGEKLTNIFRPCFPLGYEYQPFSPVLKNPRFAVVRETPSKLEQTLSTEQLLGVVFRDA